MHGTDNLPAAASEGGTVKLRPLRRLRRAQGDPLDRATRQPRRNRRFEFSTFRLFDFRLRPQAASCFSIIHLPFSVSFASALGAAGAPDALHHSARLYAALIYLVVLLVIVVFGFWALARLSRRYRERLRRAGEAPTAVPDVWQMHRLPEDTESRESDEEPGHGR